MLKPIDITVLAYVVSADVGSDWTQSELAQDLGVSQSNIHRALKQLEVSELLVRREPRRSAFRDLIVYAVRHVYPASMGAPARGVPTAHSAPALAERFRSDLVLVWPHDGAAAYGTSLEPMHDCVPAVALRVPAFHNMMALIDVMRVGRARERDAALGLLDKVLLGTMT